LGAGWVFLLILDGGPLLWDNPNSFRALSLPAIAVLGAVKAKIVARIAKMGLPEIKSERG
jgi:hypothetical protein